MSSGFSKPALTLPQAATVADTAPRTAVARTIDAMKSGGWSAGRCNQASAFLKRARKSDKRRRMENATRRRMRGR